MTGQMARDFIADSKDQFRGEKKRKLKKKKPLLGVFSELPVKPVNMCEWEKVWGLIEMLRLAAALRVNLFAKAAERQLRHIKELRCSWSRPHLPPRQ